MERGKGEVQVVVDYQFDENAAPGDDAKVVLRCIEVCSNNEIDNQATRRSYCCLFPSRGSFRHLPSEIASNNDMTNGGPWEMDHHDGTVVAVVETAHRNHQRRIYKMQ